jgi:nucleoid DNA-binding protein
MLETLIFVVLMINTMQRTKEVNEVLEAVRKKCMDELGINISDEDIFNIVNHQFSFVATCIKKDEELRLPKFGTFTRMNTVKDKYFDKLERKGIVTDGLKKHRNSKLAA